MALSHKIYRREGGFNLQHVINDLVGAPQVLLQDGGILKSLMVQDGSVDAGWLKFYNTNASINMSDTEPDWDFPFSASKALNLDFVDTLMGTIEGGLQVAIGGAEGMTSTAHDGTSQLNVLVNQSGA
jgi:hypothetical protein